MHLPATPTHPLPASIREVTPYGSLPPISLAFRNSLNDSGVASTSDLSEYLTHQREYKSTRLLKCNDTLTSSSTNVGTLRNLISTKKAKDSIKLPQISNNKKHSTKKCTPGRIPDAALIVETNQKSTIKKPYHFVAHDQSSSEEEDD